MPTYEEKFASLLRMVAEAKQSGVEAVVVHQPHMLGDTCAELVQSLNHIANAELNLRILPCSVCGKPDLPLKKRK